MLRKLTKYFLRFIIEPGKAAQDISQEKKALWIGFWWLITFHFLYSLTVLIFFLLGHKPVATPWLPIPPDKWYLIQTFTTIPVGLAGFLTYSGVAYLLVSATDRKPEFDTIFTTQSFTIFIPCIIFMWIPETFVAPFLIMKGMDTLPWSEWIENLRVFIIPFLWIFYMSTLTLTKITHLPWWKSLIIVIISLIPCGLIMAVFIR